MSENGLESNQKKVVTEESNKRNICMEPISNKDEVNEMSKEKEIHFGKVSFAEAIKGNMANTSLTINDRELGSGWLWRSFVAELKSLNSPEIVREAILHEYFSI
ncbi:hypothetical protein RHGRI_025068 [Rhododendron griersonianum]|uniref:Uncharacterized protein n=1 Tax=Rhododendron griersonianum TaxID=479676 RepID=A0AAV6J9I3_9ERIC|nr:hypothetical protein RHGRI_025068 [Rhododendron griersonianum]